MHLLIYIALYSLCVFICYGLERAYWLSAWDDDDKLFCLGQAFLAGAILFLGVVFVYFHHDSYKYGWRLK
jgi:hypothetical protein